MSEAQDDRSVTEPTAVAVGEHAEIATAATDAAGIGVGGSEGTEGDSAEATAPGGAEDTEPSIEEAEQDQADARGDSAYNDPFTAIPIA
jgi:hypothetical protein